MCAVRWSHFLGRLCLHTRLCPRTGSTSGLGVCFSLSCCCCLFFHTRIQSFSKNLGDLIVLVFIGEGSSERIRQRNERNRNSTPRGVHCRVPALYNPRICWPQVCRVSGAPSTWFLFHSSVEKKNPGFIVTQSELVWPCPALYSLGNPGGSFYPITARFIINQARSCKMNFSSVSSSKRDQQLSGVSITSVPRNVTCYLISGHHLLNIPLDPSHRIPAVSRCQKAAQVKDKE